MLKAILVKWEWEEPYHDRWSCEENYTLPERRTDIPSDYEMLAKWMISGGGSRMTIEFTGYQIVIEAIYEGDNHMGTTGGKDSSRREVGESMAIPAASLFDLAA